MVKLKIDSNQSDFNHCWHLNCVDKIIHLRFLIKVTLNWTVPRGLCFGMHLKVESLWWTFGAVGRIRKSETLDFLLTEWYSCLILDYVMRFIIKIAATLWFQSHCYKICFKCHLENIWFSKTIFVYNWFELLEIFNYKIILRNSW